MILELIKKLNAIIRKMKNNKKDKLDKRYSKGENL